jgi:hypothetical protein
MLSSCRKQVARGPLRLELDEPRLTPTVTPAAPVVETKPSAAISWPLRWSF